MTCVFITGDKGFIGGELSKFLSARPSEFEIIGYDIKDGKDILDYERLVEEMHGSDVVVHLAAIRGPYDDKTFDDYFRVNCIGTFNVARAALENKVKRFIYASSTSYYGLEKGIPYMKPIKETNPVVAQYLKVDDLKCRDSDIAYSTSKVIAEQILANYGLRKKFEVIILRFGPIGGKLGERWALDGITLKIENAIQALNLAITTKKRIWYEAFTITDNVPNVDLTKAREILGYNPI